MTKEPLRVLLIGEGAITSLLVDKLYKRGIQLYVNNLNLHEKFELKFKYKGVVFYRKGKDTLSFDYVIGDLTKSVAKNKAYRDVYEKVVAFKKKIAICNLSDTIRPSGEIIYKPQYFNSGRLSVSKSSISTKEGEIVFLAIGARFVDFILSKLFSFKSSSQSFIYANAIFNIPQNAFQRKISPSTFSKLIPSSTVIYEEDLDEIFISEKIKSPHKRLINTPTSRYLKKIFLISGGLLFGFLVPILLLLIGGGIGLWSFRYLQKGDILHARKAIVLSKPFIEGAYTVASGWSRIPLLGIPYRQKLVVFSLAKEGIELSRESFSFADKAKQAFSQVYSDTPVNFSDFENLSTELTFLSQQAQLLRNDVFEESFISSKFSYSQKQKIDRGLGQLSSISNFLKEAPLLLGKEEKKSYLVLFQNNMELRATGGFIGSFAIISFDNGKLEETSVYDVYTADGQLKGHVDPPYPLVKYFEHPNWYLRDANWDPDFPTTAKTLQWFLDKELGISVDGVIGIDLEFLKTLLENTSALNLSDFDLTIDKSNFYEVTQREIEEKFFPGSKLKAKLLSALAEELKAKIFEPHNIFAVGKSTYFSLEQKHIQIYLNNPTHMKTVSELGWSGEVVPLVCQEFCVPDTLMVIDSNLGVNKGNYHLKRKFDLDVKLSDSKILHSLTVTFTNNTTPSITPNEIYKTYLRIIVPRQSQVSPIKIVSQNDVSVLREPEEYLRKDLQEIGVWIEIQPGETTEVIFSWEDVISNFQDKTSFALKWYKQAGTVDDSVKLSISTPQGTLVSSPSEALLLDNIFLYNAPLLTDQLIILDWKKL